ncbi:hypothetical protein BCR33DRAFT_716537, partial [Rhizoclosmatium globosum]
MELKPAPPTQVAIIKTGLALTKESYLISFEPNVNPYSIVSRSATPSSSNRSKISTPKSVQSRSRQPSSLPPLPPSRTTSIATTDVQLPAQIAQKHDSVTDKLIQEFQEADRHAATRTITPWERQLANIEDRPKTRSGYVEKEKIAAERPKTRARATTDTPTTTPPQKVSNEINSPAFPGLPGRTRSRSLGPSASKRSLTTSEKTLGSSGGVFDLSKASNDDLREARLPSLVQELPPPVIVPPPRKYPHRKLSVDSNGQIIPVVPVAPPKGKKRNPRVSQATPEDSSRQSSSVQYQVQQQQQDDMLAQRDMTDLDKAWLDAVAGNGTDSDSSLDDDELERMKEERVRMLHEKEEFAFLERLIPLDSLGQGSAIREMLLEQVKMKEEAARKKSLTVSESDSGGGSGQSMQL